MDAAIAIAALVTGAALGFSFALLWLRGRDQALQAVLRERDAQLGETKAALEREQARVDTADQKVEQIRGELANAKAVEAALRRDLEAERNLAREKLAAFQQAEERLRDAFKALTTDALKDSSEQFLKLAEENLKKLHEAGKGDLEQRQKAVENLIEPIQKSLEKVNTQVQELEKARAQAYGSLTEQVKNLALSQQKLEAETGNLVKALRAPTVRGRWGEIHLKRVVELAGMLEHCDFVQQASVDSPDGRLQPDLLVNLPGGKQVVVDAKAPLQAYLDALEAPDEGTRQAKLDAHAGQIQTHLKKLGAKAYWDQFPAAPEFVVMFLPGEVFFSAALERKPALIEEGVGQRVILATPTTLIALLRAVAYGWRQDKIAESAQEISQLGSDLYERLAIMTEHFAKVGDHLERATKSYNDTIGSLERNVLSAARRFPQLGATSRREIPILEPTESTPREIQARDLRRSAKSGE
jgi:DNA recombination protein RmuC